LIVQQNFFFSDPTTILDLSAKSFFPCRRFKNNRRY